MTKQRLELIGYLIIAASILPAVFMDPSFVLLGFTGLLISDYGQFLEDK